VLYVHMSVMLHAVVQSFHCMSCSRTPRQSMRIVYAAQPSNPLSQMPNKHDALSSCAYGTDLVQQDRVCIGNLLLSFIDSIRRAVLFLQLPLNVLCVNNSDNGI